MYGEGKLCHHQFDYKCEMYKEGTTTVTELVLLLKNSCTTDVIILVTS